MLVLVVGPAVAKVTPADVEKIRDANTLREAFMWKVEDYFTDPAVVKLCQAIEHRDAEAIKSILDSGVDVNSLGVNSMTPLLWSIPIPISDEVEIMELLLKSGADPNIKFGDDYGSRGRLPIGNTVTTHVARYGMKSFELVMEHGGDPEATDNFGASLLQRVIKYTTRKDKLRRIDLILAKGADIDRRADMGMTPAMLAVAFGGQYGVALDLLKRGASYQIFQLGKNQRLIHPNVSRSDGSPDSGGARDQLIQYLEERGESVADAEADFKRWHKWRDEMSGEKFMAKLKQEVDQRLEREAAATAE